MMTLQRRGRLARTRHQLRNSALPVGFSGGSITNARPGWNWPEPVMAWLVEQFPAVRLCIENAAIRQDHFVGTNLDLALIGVLP